MDIQLKPKIHFNFTKSTNLCGARSSKIVTESVCKASNIRLSPTVVDDTLDYIKANLEDMHASMYTDLVEQRPLELESLTGAVIRAGITGCTSTPINDLIYAMLKPYAEGA